MMKQVKLMPKRMLALICGLILSITAFAQQITVRVAGQQGGVITDFDGNFHIQANSGATITVSYVG